MLSNATSIPVVRAGADEGGGGSGFAAERNLFGEGMPVLPRQGHLGQRLVGREAARAPYTLISAGTSLWGLVASWSPWKLDCVP